MMERQDTMDVATAKKIINQKEPPGLYEIVEPVLHDIELRDRLVEGSFDKNETVRYNCVRILFRALSREPQQFYGYWDRFAEMITSPNGFHRSAAAQAIAYLASVDTDCRLDRVLKPYLALIDDSKVMVSHYFLETLGLIYRARPDLQKRILATLFGIERTNHPLERKELLKADILALFDQLYEMLPVKEQKKAFSFAKVSLHSKSGKTRKAAKAFVAVHLGQAGLP